MCQFSGKTKNFDFFGTNWPKNGLLGGNFKNLSPDSESAPPRYHVRQFSVKINNFEFFGIYLGKLPNYVWYFSSNNVEGVAESWMEVDGAGWRWVQGLVILVGRIEVNSRFFVKDFTLRNILKCHLISWCGNFLKKRSFRRVSGDSPKRSFGCFHKISTPRN